MSLAGLGVEQFQVGWRETVTERDRETESAVGGGGKKR